MTGPIGSLRLTVKAMRGGWAPFSPLRPLRPCPPEWPWGPRSPLGPMGPCIPHSPFCPLRPRWPFAPFSPGTPCRPATHSLPLSHIDSRQICLSVCMIMVFCADLKNPTTCVQNWCGHCLYFLKKKTLCVCVCAPLSTIWKGFATVCAMSMALPCMFGVLYKLSIIFTTTIPTLIIPHMCTVKGHFSERWLCSCTSTNTLVLCSCTSTNTLVLLLLLLCSSFYGGRKLVFWGDFSFLLPCGLPHSIFKGWHCICRIFVCLNHSMAASAWDI